MFTTDDRAVALTEGIIDDPLFPVFLIAGKTFEDDSVCPGLKKVIQHPELCLNVSFWRDIPCGYSYKRCTGNIPGQCTLGSFCDCKAKCCRPCADNSNRVCPVKHSECKQGDMWMCRDNSQCIHYSLVCDGHEQCMDKSDEGTELCGQCPPTLNLTDRHHGNPLLLTAIFSCRHRYTKRAICAVPCNQRDDLCENYEDEICDDSTDLSLSIVAGCLIFTFLLSEAVYRFSKSPESGKRIKCKSYTAGAMNYF